MKMIYLTPLSQIQRQRRGLVIISLFFIFFYIFLFYIFFAFCVYLLLLDFLNVSINFFGKHLQCLFIIFGIIIQDLKKIKVLFLKEDHLFSTYFNVLKQNPLSENLYHVKFLRYTVYQMVQNCINYITQIIKLISN